MVLAASIVGSGELIATTTLGAQVGFRRPLDHPRQLRDQARGAGRVRALHDRDRRYGARGLQSRAGSPRGRRLACLGVGDHRHAVAAADRRDVRRRLAGAEPPRPRDLRQRVGRHLLRDHPGAAARRRVRANRAARDREGRTLHAADRLRGRDPAPSSGRRGGPRSRGRHEPAASRRGPRDGDRRLRHHRRGRDRAGHVSVLVRRERLRALRRSARRIARVGGAARAAGFASCTSTSSARW